jgi:hypothetical protein
VLAPRLRQFVLQRIEKRACPLSIGVIQAPEGFGQRRRLRVSAEHARRRKQLARVSRNSAITADLECEIPAKHERVDMGLETLFEVAETGPWYLWICMQRAALVVQK